MLINSTAAAVAAAAVAFSSVAFHSESELYKGVDQKRPAGRAAQRYSGVQMLRKGSSLVVIVLLTWDDGFRGHHRLVYKMM